MSNARSDNPAVSTDDRIARTRLAMLVVDRQARIGDFLRARLSGRCDLIDSVDDAASADHALARRRYDLLLVNTELPDAHGSEWIRRRRDEGDPTPVLFVSEHKSEHPDPRLPATDWLAVPFALDQLLAAIGRLLDIPQPTDIEHEDTVTPGELTVAGMVYRSDVMADLVERVRRVAHSNTTVLIEGESGTGKELIARCIHRYSGRPGPFTAINCSSIAPELVESELFGHVQGAFTGATQTREGVMRYSHGGSLLLDEIGDMPRTMQAKLLRVLEEHVIRPVGSEREVSIDVRVIAATNRSMADAVAAGEFRGDLFHRLNVIALQVPPLRERPEDIPALVHYFAGRLACQLQVPPLAPSSQEMERLQHHPWPGNVRELKNLVERAMLLDCSPLECLADTDIAAPAGSGAGYREDVPMAAVERDHMLKVLAAAGGNKSKAARRLGVNRKTLERKVKAWIDGGK